MPLFQISGKNLISVEQENFPVEKELQKLIESNLETVFNCRLIASEFSTGARHRCRIDSLALSENNNPVIIEYKKVGNSDLINQSLEYFDWIQDHEGDFEIAAQKKIGKGVEIDWSDVRIICIAPNYKKRDLKAVQAMIPNIELWTYRLFKNRSIYLEKVIHANKSSKHVKSDEKDETRKKVPPTFEKHLKGKSKDIQDLIHVIREYILRVDPAIKEIPQKKYVRYKISQGIIWMEPKKNDINLNVKLKPTDIIQPQKYYRDVSNTGVYGPVDVQFTISNESEFNEIKKYLELAYNKIRG